MEVPELRLHQGGIEVICWYILEDTTALRKWPEYIYSFVTNMRSRKRLRDLYKRAEEGEAIMKTLEVWLQEQGSNATFRKLIDLLRNLELNYLCGILLEKVEEINNAQLQRASTIVSKNVRSPEIWFGMKDVPKFVGRVEELKALHKLVTESHVDEHSSISMLTCVHGFGGIGKTSLAMKYGWKYRNYFHGNVIWIDSEKFGTMRSAFKEVAKMLNLKVAKTPNLDLPHLTKAVYNAFADSNCLFIFDNAKNFNGRDGLEQFLPSGIIGKPYLLLTTRRRDCFPTDKVLSLNVLTPSDSIQLIKKYLSTATDEIAGTLAEKLDRLPLAILQAIAYIKNSFLPLYCSSSETDVSKSINSFLEEYQNNSKKILKYEFICLDRYAKNIYSICEMSLQRMKNKEGGKLARHMLKYISFLDPDNIQLDLFLKLDYAFEDILKVSELTNPNKTLELLFSYSLVDINITERTIKVHRLVQEVMSCTSSEEEVIYVFQLLNWLKKQEYNESLSHWITIQRSCRFENSRYNVKANRPPAIVLLGPLNSAGLNFDVSKKFLELLSKYGIHREYCKMDNPKYNFITSLTKVIRKMNCANINESVEAYVDVYSNISVVLGKLETINLLWLTNYLVFANFIVSEKHKNIFQSMVECFSLLMVRRFEPTLIRELLGENFPSEEMESFLDILRRSIFKEMFDCSLYEGFEEYYPHFLFDLAFKVPTTLLNEFPCLSFLKLPSSFNNTTDELQALNLSWDYKNSSIWPLFNTLGFSLETVRQAIVYINHTGCTIAKYIQKYKTIIERKKGDKQPEFIVQLINAKYLIKYNSDQHNVLTLICCLRPEFDLQKIEYIRGVNKRSLPTISPFIWRLNYWWIVKRKTCGIYFIDRSLQVALRKVMLPRERKAWAVKALHKACVKSKNGKGLAYYDELVKDWNHLMEQKDLKKIAVKADLFFADC